MFGIGSVGSPVEFGFFKLLSAFGMGFVDGLNGLRVLSPITHRCLWYIRLGRKH